MNKIIENARYPDSLFYNYPLGVNICKYVIMWVIKNNDYDMASENKNESIFTITHPKR